MTDEKSAGTPLAPLHVDAHMNLRDHVHQSLRMAIISGRFEKGVRLNERRLAEDLGVSTTPVKEALRQLAAEGLIEVRPRRGLIVCFDRAFAEEMILARAALESTIAALAAARITEAQKEDLRAIIADMEKATKGADADFLVELNTVFHNAIHDASRSVHMTHLVDLQMFYDKSARRVIHDDETERGRALKEHRQIAAAIIDGDPERAEQAMREHVRRSGEHYMKAVFPQNKQKE